MRLRPGARLGGVIAAVALVLVLAPPTATGADAPYTLTTVADYAVDPAAGEIEVTVAGTFTNTTPNPPGQTSGFDRIDLPVHDGASQVAAADAKGALTVDLVTRDGVPVASVRARARVRYNRSVSFTLTYRLADGAAAGIHVRHEVVKFAAWGFGTSSEVGVQLPSGYQARADGEPMLIASGAAAVRMTSGPIADPAAWLALVTASLPATYADPLTASVALASGTVDLQVRAWVGDPGWGDRTLETLEAGLPRLEAAIGLPYPRVGPLVVTEVVGDEGAAALEPLTQTGMQVAFDADAFTLLHQAAHIWITDQLVGDRWLREGLASHEAATVAAGLGEPLPYDPSARATQLAADAVPLVDWGSGSTISGRDAYAHAASWASVDRLARGAGEAGMARALRRVVAGVSAYDPVDADQLPPTAQRIAAVDTRRFLDQLAAASGLDVIGLVAPIVFGPDAAQELEERTLARSDYLHLLGVAGDWGAPDPIRNAMSAWRFGDASAAMEAALTWLAGRDALIVKVARGGLTVPEQLRRQFAAVGGGPDAAAELAAESAVVDAYLALESRSMGDRGPLETIGLFAADDPRTLLAMAAGDYRRGDLRSAAAALDAAQVQLNRAAPNGVVRIASAIVLVAVGVLLWTLAVRRRDGTHYTGAR